MNLATPVYWPSLFGRTETERDRAEQKTSVLVSNGVTKDQNGALGRIRTSGVIGGGIKAYLNYENITQVNYDFTSSGSPESGAV